MVPRGARRARPGSPERERFWFRPGHGRGRRAAAERLAVDLRRLGLDAHEDADGAPGEWYLHLFAPEQPDLNWTHPDVWVEHEDVLRFWFDRGVAGVRIDSAALLVKDPELRRGGARRAPGRAPVHRPRRAARDLPPLARDRRLLRRAARARRRGLAARCRALRALPARPTSCTPRSTSTSSRARGRPGRCARSIDDGARGARAGRRAGHLGALEPRRHPAGHALRPRRHVVRLRVEARRHADRPRARHAPRPGGRAARDGAARLDVRLPGRGARPARGRGHPRTSAARTRCGLRSGGVDPGRDGCRVPLPWAGERAAVRLQPPRGRDRPGSTSPTTGRALTVEAESADPRPRCSPSTAPACASVAPTPWAGDGGLRWLPTATTVLAFARGERFVCIVNFGPDPVALPAGASVLIASNELEGGALPQDTTVWLRQARGSGSVRGTRPTRPDHRNG